MQGLALVSLILPSSAAPLQNADSQSAHTTLMASRLRLLGVGTSSEVPPAVAEAMGEVLAIVAMQFQGYFFQSHPQLVTSAARAPAMHAACLQHAWWGAGVEHAVVQQHADIDLEQEDSLQHKLAASA